MDLQNKVVWLTGASSGIGEALATAFGREKVKLVLSARRGDELIRVAKATGLSESDYMILPLDLENQASFEDKRNEVLQRFGGIDILVNNGGISQRSLASETDVAVDRKLMEVNYFGTVALSKSVLKHMMQRKSGMIVTVTSAVGKFGSPWRSGYAASKHALHGFFDSLRAEVYNDGIQILLVCPGFIQTNVSKNALTGTGTALGSMDNATANGLTAAECASQIVKAIQAEKQEVFVGGFKERLGIWMKRISPWFLSVMLRKMAVR